MTDEEKALEYIRNNFVNLEQASERLNRGRYSIWNYIKKGNRYSGPLPTVNLLGKILLRKTDLNNYKV